MGTPRSDVIAEDFSNRTGNYRDNPDNAVAPARGGSRGRHVRAPSLWNGWFSHPHFTGLDFIEIFTCEIGTPACCAAASAIAWI